MSKQGIPQELLQIIHQKGAIRDEMIFYTINVLAEKFVEDQEDFSAQLYTQLLNKLNKLWQYKQYEDLSSEQSYLYGGIWGCLSMLSCIQKKKKTSQRCHTMALKYQTDSMYTFLSAIYDKPGIQNKNLAEICGVSTARISQISNDALKDGLISMQTLGREKGYFIRTAGEAVYDILKEKRNGLTISSDKRFDYKVLFFSNEDNRYSPQLAISLINRLNSDNRLAIAIAFSEKQTEIPVSAMYALMSEGGNKPWESVTTNLDKEFNPFCNVLKEAGTIR